jgi:hypothetical protein
MSTGQTILTLAALMFLSTILLNFYGLLADTGDDIATGQDGILATTMATSYMELASGMAFDEITDTSDIAIQNVNALTPVTSLGPESSNENSIEKFNDFDDFKGFQTEKEVGGTGRRFRATFNVHYVNPLNVSQISSGRTFVKRLDVKIWRTYPAAGGARLDTLNMSQVMGYFHFD